MNSLRNLPTTCSTTGDRIELSLAQASLALGVLFGKPINWGLTATAVTLQVTYTSLAFALRLLKAWWAVFKQPTVSDSLVKMRQLTETPWTISTRSQPNEIEPVRQPDSPQTPSGHHQTNQKQRKQPSNRQ